MYKTVHLRAREQKHLDKKIILESFLKISHFLKKYTTIQNVLLYYLMYNNRVTCKTGKIVQLINKFKIIDTVVILCINLSHYCLSDFRGNISHIIIKVQVKNFKKNLIS